jgi:polyisoprenoid-binding protein YceI
MALVVSLLPAQTVWNMDVNHTAIEFTVAHMVVSEVTGKFLEFKGSVTAKGSDFDGAAIDVRIKTASITTQNEKRDTHLKSADFFDVQKYPEASFVSAAMKKTGDATYEIPGTLTLHGVAKPVVLQAVFKGTAKSPWGQSVAVFKASTKINRLDYGLKWNRALETGGFLVGDEISLDLTVELIQA